MKLLINFQQGITFTKKHVKRSTFSVKFSNPFPIVEGEMKEKLKFGCVPTKPEAKHCWRSTKSGMLEADASLPDLLKPEDLSYGEMKLGTEEKLFGVEEETK